MKFNFRKISAALTSGLMIASGIGFAAAAAFPAPFSDSAASGNAIVYGANAASTDVAAVTNVNDYLASKVKSEGVAPTGESVEFNRPSTKWNVGLGLSDVVSTSVTDSSPGNGLPTLLADGKFVDNDNDEFDYTQKVDMGNISLTMFSDNDYTTDDPTLGIKIAGGAFVLNYTLDFTDKPLWADLDTADMTFMGKSYYVLSDTVNTTLNLLDSATTATLSEGETKTITVGGKAYDVSIDWIGSSTVVLNVNGETTNTLSAAQTQRLSDGAYVGVREINTQDYAGGVKRVEFSIGKGKLELVSGSEVKINDNAISNLNVYFTNTQEKLQKVVLEWKAEDDIFLTPDSEVTMPGFEALKLSMPSITFPAEEKEMVETSNAYVTLKDFQLKDGPADINILYGNGTVFTDIGKGRAVNLLATTNESTLTFNKSAHDYFVATWNDTTSGESYLMKAGSVSTADTGVTNTTTVYYYKDGGWVEAKTDAKTGDTIDIGNLQLTVNVENAALDTVSFNASSGVNFHTAYTKEGLMVYLPYTSAFGASQMYGWINLTGAATSNQTFLLKFAEEDKNGNLGHSDAVIATLGWDSDLETSVTAVTGGEGTSTEIGDTNVYRNFVYSPLATEILWYKPSGGSQDLTLMYHGEESYTSVFLTAPDATLGTVGNMIFKDSEMDSWKTRNVILVGGSCINSATATVLGGAYCSDEFESNTGVGTGQFMVASYADKFSSGKIALVVAGYNAADTTAAVANLIAKPESYDTAAGKTYKGTVVAGGSVEVTSA